MGTEIPNTTAPAAKQANPAVTGKTQLPPRPSTAVKRPDTPEKPSAHGIKAPQHSFVYDPFSAEPAFLAHIIERLNYDVQSESREEAELDKMIGNICLTEPDKIVKALVMLIEKNISPDTFDSFLKCLGRKNPGLLCLLTKRSIKYASGNSKAFEYLLVPHTDFNTAEPSDITGLWAKLDITQKERLLKRLSIENISFLLSLEKEDTGNSLADALCTKADNPFENAIKSLPEALQKGFDLKSSYFGNKRNLIDYLIRSARKTSLWLKMIEQSPLKAYNAIAGEILSCSDTDLLSVCAALRMLPKDAIISITLKLSRKDLERLHINSAVFNAAKDILEYGRVSQ